MLRLPFAHKEIEGVKHFRSQNIFYFPCLPTKYYLSINGRTSLNPLYVVHSEFVLLVLSLLKKPPNIFQP